MYVVPAECRFEYFNLYSWSNFNSVFCCCNVSTTGYLSPLFLTNRNSKSILLINMFWRLIWMRSWIDSLVPGNKASDIFLVLGSGKYCITETPPRLSFHHNLKILDMACSVTPCAQCRCDQFIKIRIRALNKFLLNLNWPKKIASDTLK